jgi:hypothetical protein
VVGQALGYVAGPGLLESGDQLDLIDQAFLHGEQSEKEMAIGDGNHGTAPGQMALRCQACDVKLGFLFSIGRFRCDRLCFGRLRGDRLGGFAVTDFVSCFSV